MQCYDPTYRLLGKFVEAAKDLRTACKIDFDDTADEWLKEVTPNVSERKRCSVIARSLLIPGPL